MTARTNEWVEISLDTVCRNFAKGFTGDEIVRGPNGDPLCEWYVDTGKGCVIFRLTTKRESK